MSTQGSISRELFQSVSVESNSATYRPPAGTGCYITVNPVYSSAFLFVRTPVGIQVQLPPLTGVVTDDTLPVPVAGPIKLLNFIPNAYRPVVNTKVLITSPTAGAVVPSYIIFQTDGTLLIGSALGAPNFTPAAAFSMVPELVGYSASSVLEVTE